MFRLRFVWLWCPEITAFLTRLPRARVLITLVGIAQAKAFVLLVTAPATSHGPQGGVAAYPLLATRRLHERRRGSATKTTRRPQHGLGFG